MERRRRILLLALVGVLVVGAGVWIFRWRTAPAPQPMQPVATAIRSTDIPLARTTAGPAAVARPTSVARPEAPPVGDRPPMPAPPAALFFDTQRLTYEPAFYAPQIQAFLDGQPGPLKHMTFPVGNRQHTFAEVLAGQTIYASLNPKVLLALLEVQSQLLSTSNPSGEQLAWAMNYHGENGNRRGLTAQVRWARSQMTMARRMLPTFAPLTYADGSSQPPPPGMTASEYLIARALAPTTTPDRLAELLQRFLAAYTRLFGDPRSPPDDWPAPSKPFLIRPMEHAAKVTSFFDHDTPFLGQNGSTFSYWGRAEADLSYDGHDGWDYGLMPPDMVLAAADGEVAFAGNADDNCATQAVVIDHQNGYRTLYWHLSRIDVAAGQHIAAGQPIGMVGNSGCSLGPHLHFGVQYLGRAIDPYGWCGGATPDPWEQHPFGTRSAWLWADRPSPCAAPPEGAIVVDTDSAGFAKSGAGWQMAPLGYGGSALFIPSVRGNDAQPWDLRPDAEPAVALYRPTLPAAARYRVLAYIPYVANGMDDATHVRYRIQHTGGEAEVWADDQVYANDWVDLGTYEFDPGTTPLVALSNLAEDNQRGVWADAVMWLPVEGN